MRAAWFETTGPAEKVLKIGDWPDPEPAIGEVRVKLHTSGINPSDVKKRDGQSPLFADLPVIPHSDGAGVIDAVGAGVPKTRIGERVWVYQAQYQRRFGTAAVFVSLPAPRAVRLPEKASFAEGACLGIPAMTAHRCVFADGNVAGRSVLVTGAGGRVGFYAVQWAKWGGARVFATVGGDANALAARDAGADVVINHRTDDVAKAVLDATDGAGVDRIVEVEFGRNLATATKVIRAGGVIATYASSGERTPALPFYPLMFKDVTIRLVLVYAMAEQAKRTAAADIVRFLDEGHLQHRIGASFALKDIAKAHQAIERGVAGCVVVDLTEPRAKKSK